ncbi:MAG: IS200/IS605 family transposase [Candidatus Woesearchaeota archaeon]
MRGERKFFLCHALTIQVSVSSFFCRRKNKMETTNFSQGVGQNSFHLVWKPKYSWDRFKFPWIKNDCEAIINKVVFHYSMKFYELKVMLDYVECFVEIPLSMSVSKALNLLKVFSAYKIFRKHPWIRSYFRKGHLLSPGKFFRSVGNVTAEVIKNYIVQSNRATLLQRYYAL